MIIDAAEIGISGDEFWGLSQYELQLQFKGARQRADERYKLGLFVAWHVAAFMRVPKDRKLPALEPMMAKVSAKKVKPSKVQQKAVFLQVAKTSGLKVKRVPRKKA